MLWKLFQLSIFIAVVGSNGHYHWTPNGLVAGAVGLLAALLATAIVNWGLSLARLLKSLLFRSHQGRDQSGLLGRQVLDNRRSDLIP
jgi:hypothetical protein